MGKLFRPLGQVSPKLKNKSDLAWIQTRPRFYACPGPLPVWWRSNQKWNHYHVHNIFSIINVWENVSMLKGMYEPKSLVWPESELIQDFMSVLVTCKFYDDPIKNEVLLHYKSMGKCSDAQRHVWTKKSDLARKWTHPRLYVCPGYL